MNEIRTAPPAAESCLVSSYASRGGAGQKGGTLIDETVVSENARVLKGAGNALDKEGTAAGESLTKGAARVIKSMGSGTMEGFNELSITTSAALTTAGLKAERAGIAAVDGKSNNVKCHQRSLSPPRSPESPGTRGPPGDLEAVLRPIRQRRSRAGTIRSSMTAVGGLTLPGGGLLRSVVADRCSLVATI